MLPWQSDRVRDGARALLQPRCPPGSRAALRSPATGDPGQCPPSPHRAPRIPSASPGCETSAGRLFPTNRAGSAWATLRCSHPAQKSSPDKGSARCGGRRRHRGLRAAAKRSLAPRTLGFAVPLGTSPRLALTPLSLHLQQRQRAPPCRQCGSGPGRRLGAVVPCPSPDAVGRRSRDYSPRQAARPQRGWCNHTLARPGAGASAGGEKDGFARDSSRALARALLSGPEGCSAIRMQWWDLLLPWWHRNTARSVVSIAIKFAGSGHERIQRVRVTEPAPRHFS